MGNFCPKIGTKVRITTIKENKKTPIGTVVEVKMEYPEAGSLNSHYLDEVCDVRLENGGVLIKNVHPNELNKLTK